MMGKKTVDSVLKQFRKAHDDLAAIEGSFQNQVQDLEDQRKDPCRPAAARGQRLMVRGSTVLAGYGLAGSVIAMVLTAFAAWGTHIVHTIQHAEYILLAVGAFIAPVGMIHGLMIWFGAS